jgi:transcription factor IIIB subunit 2
VNRFTRGRRSDQVAAVCLYAVCRTEKSSHMLIDFSDILQVNVFTLGATFLKLCRVLNLNLPHVDPSLYISRFAVALDFGDYTQRVAQDAVRIAQRMDRDWITSGRRPAGICGACLLIAARMNGFRRTTREMIYVVKVADVTIQKRLYEFNQTESAQLSVRDFRTIWLEKRADPPSFQKNRKKAEGAESEVEMDGFSSDSENEMGTRKRKGKGRANGSRPEKRRAVTLNEDEDEDELNRVSDEEVNGPFGNKQKNISKADNGANVNNTNSKTSMEEDTEEIEQELIQKQIEDSLNQEVRLIADTDASLSAQASIVKPKGKEKAILDEDATLVDIQTMSDNENEQTFVDDSEAEYIPVKSAAYEALTTEQKMELTAIAKAKVAQEENELLNKDLKDDALEIAKEMEGWMEDDSIMKAAKEIGKCRMQTLCSKLTL